MFPRELANEILEFLDHVQGPHSHALSAEGGGRGGGGGGGVPYLRL
jgi:hypothetical protein